MKDLLQKIIDYGVLSIILVFPFAINLAYISPKDLGHPIFAVNLSVSDIIIAITFLLWIIKTTLYRQWKDIKLPPIFIICFLGLGLLSIVNATSIINWMKELIQLIEYLFVFYILLLNNIALNKANKLKDILLISSTMILLIAVIQHTILKADPYYVKSLFENRSILGSFLCMAVPIFYIEFLYSSNLYRRIWMLLLLGISGFIILSGSALLSIIIGISVISVYRGKKFFFGFLLVISIVIVIYPVIMPKKNTESVKEFASVYEQGSVNEKFYRMLYIINSVNRNERIILLEKNIGGNILSITCTDIKTVKYPKYEVQDWYDYLDLKKQIKSRYLEMVASLNLISNNSLFGTGLGSFQEIIGTGYKSLPQANTSEPNQNNTYLIITITMGILGLSLLLWILIQAIHSSIHRYRKSKKQGDVYLYLGLAGALIAISIEGFFSMIFNSALLVPLVLLLSMSYTKEKVKYIIPTWNISVKNVSKKILILLALLSLSFFLISNSITKVNYGKNIWVEAESAIEILAPLKIIYFEGSSRDSVVTSTGGHTHKQGYATYKLNVSEPGTYYFWGRCYWKDVCSNSFSVQLEKSNPIKIGNASQIGQWTWVAGPSIEVSGKSMIVNIYNEEIDAVVDKFLLTSNPDFVPVGLGDDNNQDIYMDFEDLSISNLIFRNKDLWTICHHKNSKSVLMMNKPTNNDLEFALIDKNEANSFTFGFCSQMIDSGISSNSLNLIFNYKDVENYNRINIDERRTSLYEKKINNEYLLCSFENDININLTNINDFILFKDSTQIYLKCNGRTILCYDSISTKDGMLGFGSSEMKIIFDNVFLKSDINVYYSNNFHQMDKIIFEEIKPEHTNDYLAQLRNGELKWWNVKGDWRLKRDGIEPLCSGGNSEENLLILGQNFWKDYSIRVAISPPNCGKFGLCFNVQDTMEYYMVKIDKQFNKCKLQLIYNSYSKEKILAQKTIKMESRQWYRLEVRQDKELKTVLIDDVPVLFAKDSTYENGKVGLWCKSEQEVSYDDIFIFQADKMLSQTHGNYKYFFTPNKEIGYSLADWYFPNPDCIQHELTGDSFDNYIYFKKELFNNFEMFNKKTVPSSFFASCLVYPCIAKDVSINMNLSANSGLNEEKYSFIITNKDATLYRNGSILANNSFDIFCREHIEVKHDSNSIWLCKVNDSIVLEYNDSITIDSMMLSLKFSGYGIDSLFIPTITLGKY